ncbi:MAG: hypothetical protein K6T83_12165 [Alicyclobacillus sp.]|nr:hypothetical protein [Alicyclobacillus sp.]
MPYDDRAWSGSYTGHPFYEWRSWGEFMNKLQNWRVLGTANSAGGSFYKVIIRGEAVIANDLMCQEMKLLGTCRVAGNLTIAEGKVCGQLDVHGELRAEKLHLLGELSVKGNCNAERLQSRGTFAIDGLLNAGRIDLTLYGDSRAQEIGCEVIRVRKHFQPFSKGYRYLTAETIEGDDIYLENTKATIVRGNRVEIGPGCDIEAVEYKAYFRKDSAAKVGREIQL